MASYPNKSMNRIHHDLCEYKKERENDQLKGIILFMPEESNIYEIHSSIEILDGIYKGIILHTILKLPQNYPNEGPSMSFPSDFDFPRNFHNHIHGTDKQICNDLLTNFKEHFSDIDRKEKPKQASGWVAGYDLNGILRQMQVFFSEPDFADGQVKLTNEEIEKLVAYCNQYKCLTCKQKPTEQEHSQEELTCDKVHLAIASDLLCPIAKKCFKNEQNLVFGYPILRKMANGKPELNIFFEYLSYEGYSIQKNERKQNEKESTSAVQGKKYNYFLPIYVNENNFNSKLTIDCLNEIKFATEQNSFKHDTLLEVFNRLINQIIVSILKDDIKESDAAIKAYCHLLRMFYRLCKEPIKEYPTLMNDVENYIDKKLKKLKEEYPGSRELKNAIQDLGEFFINIPFSNVKYDIIKLEFFKELLARQKKKN
jgi:ubiquitin-protein ligase